ncbi:MAG: AsmA-like C-terminal domain-containing protein [Marivibrio sp.]|uniref:AsmA-like C-terminal domain-containing protein n=1 Tax=Marivibrio sp. TaxID=2039719 RepID=UPI0032F07047
MTFNPRRLLLEIAAFLVVGTLLAAGAAVWKLSSGPVSLTFLTSTIEDAVNSPDASYRIALGDTQATWGGWERAIDLVATDVTIADAQGAEILTLPRVAIGLSLADLGKGVVRPTSIDLLDAELLLIRQSDGALAIAVAEGAEAGPGEPDQGTPPAPPSVEGALIPAPILDELATPPDGLGPIGELTRLILTNARIWFDDRRTGALWRGREINAVVVRDAGGLSANLSGVLLAEGARTTLTAGLDHSYDSDRFDLSASLRDAPLAVVARFAPAAESWLPMRQKANLDVSLGVDRAGRPLVATLRAETPYLAVSARADALPAEVGDAGAGPIEAAVEIERLEPARLSEVVQGLAPLGAFQASITGEGSVAYTPGDGLRRAALTLSAGEGVVVAPAVYPNGLVIYGAEADLALERGDAGEVAIEVRGASVDLGGPRAHVTGRAALDPTAGLSANADLLLTDLPMQQLNSFWPPGLAIDAREWVVPNIPRADVDQASLSIAASAPSAGDVDAVLALFDQAEPPVTIDRLGGEIEFRGAEVDYLNPLTPAEGVVGRATYDQDRFAIDLFAGRVRDIEIEGGRIEITGLQADDQAIDITLDLDAPLPTALSLLNTPPFGFVDELGLDAAAIQGGSKTKAQFGFPLVDDLEGEDVRFEAAARLSEVIVPEPSLDIVAAAPTLELYIDNRGLDVAGPVTIDGVRTVLSWRESFERSEPVARRLQLEGRPTAAELGKFGLEAIEILDGRMAATLDYRQLRSGEQRFSASADLTETAIALDSLAWSKASGRSGRLEMEAVLPAEGDVQVPLIRLDAQGEEGELSLDASLAALRDFSGLRSVQLRRLDIGPHSVRGTLARGETGVYAIQLSGPSIDISGLLGDEEDEGADPPHEEAAQEAPGPPIDLSARFDAVVDARGRRIEEVALDVRHDGEHLRQLHLDSRVPDGGGAVRIDFAPDAQGVQRLRVMSEDAGAAFSALDWTARIRGGSLLVEGERPDIDGPLSGHMTVESFTLEEAPVLAKLLEFMSLTGILSSLTQSGLDFDRAEADFSYLDGTLSLSNARAFGGALGITTQGDVNLDRDFLSLEGTVAPMYSIQRVFSAIPILGDILGGGEGLFAATYAVEGPIEEPKIAVNPLSVLAPGFLRDLFGAPSPGGADAGDAVPQRQQGN